MKNLHTDSHDSNEDSLYLALSRLLTQTRLLCLPLLGYLSFLSALISIWLSVDSLIANCCCCYYYHYYYYWLLLLLLLLYLLLLPLRFFLAAILFACWYVYAHCVLVRTLWTNTNVILYDEKRIHQIAFPSKFLIIKVHGHQYKYLFCDLVIFWVVIWLMQQFWTDFFCTSVLSLVRDCVYVCATISDR